MVHELKRDGTTILLTTQHLEEADQLADDIALVDRDRVAHTGSPRQLKAVIGSYAEVVVADTGTLSEAAGVLHRLTGTQATSDSGRGTVGAVTRDTTLTLPRLVRELDAAGVPLLDASLRPPTLDEVFLRLTNNPANHPTSRRPIHQEGTA